jgi:hypothetical protein
MLTNKVFEVQINLTNINDIYSADIESVLLSKLKENYQNRCYKGCFIVNIIQILDRSHIYIDKRNLQCSTTISIKFEADVMIYEYLDIICNNTIENITKARIECKSGKNAIYINVNGQDFSSLQVGQIIPIVVGKATYQPLQSTISINAFPFVPILIDDVIYKIDKLSEEDKQILNSSIIEKITVEQKKLRMLSKDRLKFFTDLLYPFENKINPDNSVKLEDILKLESSGYISMLNILDNSEHMLAVYKDAQDDNLVISTDPLTVYKVLLNNYFKYLRTIIELCETYKDDKIYNSHTNVFDLYKKYKKKE